MTRETRYNLIFLVVILAILIPGGIKLFRKKLDPTATMMYLPDPVAVQSAYIDSNLSNPRTRRIVPPLTSGWIAQVAEQQWPDSIAWPSVVRHRGIVSEKRTFEAVASSDAEGKRHAGLVLWNSKAVDILASVRATWGGKDAKVTTGSVVSVPRDVRKELQALGYVQPPEPIAWVMVEAPAWAGTSDDDELVISFQSPGNPGSTVVQSDTLRLRVGKSSTEAAASTSDVTTAATSSAPNPKESGTASEEKVQASPGR